MKRIASVAVKAGDRLLIGKRSDDGRCNLPGGHVDEGESPEQGAARELREETGIDVGVDRLVRLCPPHQVTTYTGKTIEVHSFLLVLPSTVATKREGTDPGEAHDWWWINVSNGLPADIAFNWHNKTDATLEALGLKTSGLAGFDNDTKVYLFEYGTLMHGDQPPKTETTWRPACIRGDVHDLGSYRGVTNIGTSMNLVHGEVGCVSLSELAAIDKREDVARGDYCRVRAVTTDGEEVYVYEYTGDKLGKSEEELEKVKQITAPKLGTKTGSRPESQIMSVSPSQADRRLAAVGMNYSVANDDVRGFYHNNVDEGARENTHVDKKYGRGYAVHGQDHVTTRMHEGFHHLSDLARGVAYQHGLPNTDVFQQALIDRAHPDLQHHLKTFIHSRGYGKDDVNQEIVSHLHDIANDKKTREEFLEHAVKDYRPHFSDEEVEGMKHRLKKQVASAFKGMHEFAGTATPKDLEAWSDYFDHDEEARKMETEDNSLEKAWPREYNRVQGQEDSKKVASKRQYGAMAAIASGKRIPGYRVSQAQAKEYIAGVDKDSLPEEGTDGKRGERERNRHAKKHGKDKAEKADDGYEESEAEAIKRRNRPKVTTFGEQVQRIKDKYKEKKPKTFEEQVAGVKQRYKKPLDKSSDLFYAKVEGLLEKGDRFDELLSGLMDAELVIRNSGNEQELETFYKTADKLFDATLSPEEQAVYELAYLAKCGDEDALEALEKFTVEMYDELLKSVSIEDVVGDMVAEALDKSNYGPKSINGEKVSLYNDKDNINRKATRTGEVRENVGQNKAVQRFTPSVNGTFAEQAAREAKADQKKSKANPVRVLTEEEKAAFKPAKKEPMARAEAAPKAYHIHQSGHRITDKPLSMQEIQSKHGGVKRLESAGFKLVPQSNELGKSADNSRVVGKKNGHSVRKVHGYYRYTSGPKRGEYVHRHEAEKRIGRKLSSKEHVDHKDGNRGSIKNTKVMSAGAHAAKTNSTRANSKGYSGGKRYEHTRD